MLTYHLHMEESMSEVVSKRKRYIAFGLILLFGGLTMAVLTFITVIGPILGLLIAFAGLMVLFKSGQHELPPPD